VRQAAKVSLAKTPAAEDSFMTAGMLVGGFRRHQV